MTLARIAIFSLIPFLLFEVKANVSLTENSSYNISENDDRISVQKVPELGTKQQQALEKLKEIINIRGTINKTNQLPKPPPYMIDLYNITQSLIVLRDTIGDPVGISQGRSAYNAKIIRGFVEKDTSLQNVFHFNISGLEANEFILEAELRLYREKHHRATHPSFLSNPNYLIRVYQVLKNRSLDEPDLHRLLNIQYVEIYGSDLQVFNVKQAVLDWLNGAPNLGLLVTATTLVGDEVSIHFIRRYNNSNISKQPLLVLFIDDGKRDRINRNQDVSCDYSNGREENTSPSPNSEEDSKNKINEMEQAQERRNQKQRRDTESQPEEVIYEGNTKYSKEYFKREKKKDEKLIRDEEANKIELMNISKKADLLPTNSHKSIVSKNRDLLSVLRNLDVYERSVLRKEILRKRIRKPVRSRRFPKIHSELRQETLRSKRDVQTSNNEACSKRDLYVDFEAVGLGSRIIAPKGYSAYQCRGLCGIASNLNQRSTNHALIQGIMREMNLVNDVDMPSCVPTKMLSTAILFYDEYDNIVLKIYDDMIADRCGCR